MNNMKFIYPDVVEREFNVQNATTRQFCCAPAIYWETEDRCGWIAQRGDEYWGTYLMGIQKGPDQYLMLQDNAIRSLIEDAAETPR